MTSWMQRTIALQTMPAWLVAGIVLAAGPSGALAQTAYKCNNGGGTYYSDRPCENGPAGQSGKVVVKPSPQGQQPPLDDLENWWRFMSPACRQLYEQVRSTMSSRDYRSQAAATARARYRQQCDEEEQMARQQLYRYHSERRNERRQALLDAQAEQQREASKLEQCAEMRRIRAAKLKQQSTMTPGERSDFARFEEGFQARCKAP